MYSNILTSLQYLVTISVQMQIPQIKPSSIMWQILPQQICNDVMVKNKTKFQHVTDLELKNGVHKAHKTLSTPSLNLILVMPTDWIHASYTGRRYFKIERLKICDTVSNNTYTTQKGRHVKHHYIVIFFIHLAFFIQTHQVFLHIYQWQSNHSS